MRGTLVLLGIMGRTPFAGVAWQALHYLEGFGRLGWDVTYVEDTGDWPYDPEQNTITDDCRYTVRYIARLMAWCGLSDQWAYCAAGPDGAVYGLSSSRLAQVLERADVLVNLTGATMLRDEHLRVPVRVYLETDPVRPQIEVARGSPFYLELLGSHTHHFSFGENLGAGDCGVPVERFRYRPTRQPVVREWWAGEAARDRPPGPAPSPARFTTVANWRQTGKDVEWNGVTYTWSKHHEFLRFLDLPRRTSRPLELALAWQGHRGNGADTWVPLHAEDAEAIRLLRSHGWRVVDAMALSREIFPYRDYIRASRGEFTVAKDQNVRLRSGWFSDRSACYLAAGRPVITQRTGFEKILPTGAGLFAFDTLEDARAALEAVDGDYPQHARAARDIAEHYFDAEIVLTRFFDDLGA